MVVLDDGTARVDVGRQVHDYERWLDQSVAEDPLVLVAAHEPGLQMYTSGTTGRPKGAVFSTAALRANAPMGELLGLHEDARVLIAMPVFQAAGSTFAAQALMAGGECVVARDVTVEHLLALIEERQVTVAPLVPVTLRTLLEFPALDARDLSSLKAIAYAGSPISEPLLADVLRCFRCDVSSSTD